MSRPAKRWTCDGNGIERCCNSSLGTLDETSSPKALPTWTRSAATTVVPGSWKEKIIYIAEKLWDRENFPESDHKDKNYFHDSSRSDYPTCKIYKDAEDFERKSKFKMRAARNGIAFGRNEKIIVQNKNFRMSHTFWRRL